MKRLVAWVVACGMASFLGLTGCSGGCGCGGDREERRAATRKKIPSKKPVYKAKVVPRKPRDSSQTKVKDMGILRVGNADAKGDDLVKKLQRVPTSPGASLTVSGTPAPTEVELNQPHLQGFQKDTRAAIVTVTKAQSKLPAPKEPEEGQVEIDEGELDKKRRRRRRR